MYTPKTFSASEARPVKLAAVWSSEPRKCCQMRIAVGFKCLLAPRHTACAYCGELWFCEGEWSSVSKQCQLGWARTVGGGIWERNKLNLADTLFSVPDMLHMSTESQAGLKWIRIRTLFKHLEEVGCSWSFYRTLSLMHCCLSSGLLGTKLGVQPQSYTQPN